MSSGITKWKKGNNGKRSGSRRRQPQDIKGQLNVLKRTVRALQKTASPQWLTVYISPISSLAINQDAGGLWLGPVELGSAVDGEPDHQDFQYKYLELNVEIQNDIGLNGGLDFDAGALVQGNQIEAGGSDYKYGNNIRIMIVHFTQEVELDALPPVFGPATETCLLMDANQAYTVSGQPQVNSTLVTGLYNEQTGGKRKMYHVMYDEVLNMNDLAEKVPNLTFNFSNNGPEGINIINLTRTGTPQCFLTGNFIHKIKLDLRSMKAAKVTTYVGATGEILKAIGGMALYIFSDQAGPTSSPQQYAITGPHWYARVLGRCSFTSS